MSMRTSSKKILQSFNARDRLWAAFIAHSKKLECSVDYLINEAMRTYAEQNNFIGEGDSIVENVVEDIDSLLEEEIEEIDDSSIIEGSKKGSSNKVESLLDDDDILDGDILEDEDADDLPDLEDDLDDLDLNDKIENVPPAPSETAPTLSHESSAVIPRAPRSNKLIPPGPPKATPRPVASQVAPPPQVTPPPPSQVTGSMPGDLARPVLTMIYEGYKIIIQKDNFILGRGSKSADLPIKDSNVSRKHAAIIYYNGAYYIKDLGSTNGVEFGNRLVDSKRIDEGDMFSICGHKFHFTYS